MEFLEHYSVSCTPCPMIHECVGVDLRGAGEHIYIYIYIPPNLVLILIPDRPVGQGFGHCGERQKPPTTLTHLILGGVSVLRPPYARPAPGTYVGGLSYLEPGF